ncbi:hypothetical protein LX36DRAFT_651706 [Colletotrichum falcatum]|nr:hypothetical protein LX36DRAFT_651706 [Colletotrichum falcatum]
MAESLDEDTRRWVNFDLPAVRARLVESLVTGGLTAIDRRKHFVALRLGLHGYVRSTMDTYWPLGSAETRRTDEQARSQIRQAEKQGSAPNWTPGILPWPRQGEEKSIVAPRVPPMQQSMPLSTHRTLVPWKLRCPAQLHQQQQHDDDDDDDNNNNNK